MRKEVRLAGFGGQGIILAGYVLGKAAALYDGKEAIFTQSYGPEARGGSCAAEVVISEEPIGYPLVSEPKYVAVMSQAAFTKYGAAAAEGAVLVVDADLVEGADQMDWARGIPATRMAQDLGTRIVGNMVMLGFFCGVTDLVSTSAMEEAIRTSVPPKTIDLNLKAFNMGLEYSRSGEKG
jgi:2-oxoglutarate ferredoxin oxidoreductase subunit gamma